LNSRTPLLLQVIRFHHNSSPVSSISLLSSPNRQLKKIQINNHSSSTLIKRIKFKMPESVISNGFANANHHGNGFTETSPSGDGQSNTFLFTSE